MTLRTIVQPTEPAVSVEDAKAFLRVVHDEDDAMIGRMIAAAQDKAEQITGRALTARELEALFEPEERAALPMPPIIDILAVSDDEGDLEYETRVEHGLTVVDPERRDGQLAVRYQAGYETVPDAVVQWILVQVSSMYEQRESFGRGADTTPMFRTFVDHLLDSYRMRIV